MSKFLKRTTNVPNFNMTPINKSGFKMGYQQAISGSIGQWLTSSQFVMPGDRASLGNSLKCQFVPLTVQMTGHVDVEQNNFYVRLRSLYGNSQFYNWLSVDTHDFSAQSESLPTISLQSLVKMLHGSAATEYGLPLPPFEFDGFVYITWRAGLSSAFTKMKNDCKYYEDFFDDLLSSIDSFGQPNATSFKDWEDNVYNAIYDRIIGGNSYLCMHQYPCVSFYELKWILANWRSGGSHSVDDWVANFSDITYNDAPLRAFYSWWFENQRSTTLERKNGLPDYHVWTFAPLSNKDMLNCLIPRYLNWRDDAYTTQSVDDPSRHVFAAIFTADSTFNYSDSGWPDGASEDNMVARGIKETVINYRNQNSNKDVSVTIPLPNTLGLNLKDFSQNDADFFRLDLQELRIAKMAETWLKRVFVSGDEYVDYHKGIYGVDLPEVIAQRPEYISSSSNSVDVSETMSNIDSADGSVMGEKRAVMAAGTGGDGETFYCPEFGIVLSNLGMRPDPIYRPTNAALRMTTFTDLPNPIMASGRDELTRKYEYGASVMRLHDTTLMASMGHTTPYHYFKQRLSSVHGDFLTEKAFYTFLRPFGSLNISMKGRTPEGNGRLPFVAENFAPLLNAQDVTHCRPNLAMFIDSNRLTSKWFGFWQHDFFVERALPVCTEII